MNIRELIEQLEEAAQEHGDELEVRLAMQPNYPFEYSIGQVMPIHFEDVGAETNAPMPVVYLSEGSQLGYLPGDASSALGWR